MMVSYMDQQFQPPVKPNEQPYYYYPSWSVPQQQQHHHHHHHHHQLSLPQHRHHQPAAVEQHQQPSPPLPQQHHSPPPLSPRPKITQSVWEDQNTFCYQVDARGICVARRQDNDMVNGTKLLNVTGISRGKRDGILKNESGRVVVKVGAMHLKGVWITFTRAKALAAQFDIEKLLHPLFEDDPSRFYEQQPHSTQQPYMNPPFYLSTTSPPPPQRSQPQHDVTIATPATIATVTTASTSSLELPQAHHHHQHFPYSYPDKWDLSLVLNNSPVFSDSAPGTPDVTNMFPPHDTSAIGLASALAPYSFASMMSLPPPAEDNLYCYYQR